MALTGVASLAACTSDDATDSAFVGSDGVFPVTMQHKFGSTTIESRPNRVVTVGFNDLDFALALGETPVATRAFTGYDYKQRPWAQGYPTDIPEVGGMELDVEKVAAANPDVLLGTYAVFTKNDYDTLSGLAPTVGDVLGTADGGTASWEDQLDAIGKALGKQGEAEKVRDRVRTAFDAATAANSQFAGRTAAVAMVLDNGFYILEPEDPRAAFFTTLGFTAPTETGTVSPERLDLLDQPTLIVLGATKEKLAADPVFSQLAVVKEDRTVYLGEFGTDATAAIGFASPLSQPYLLDVATPALSAATDDDPATVVPAIG
ncbi:ABC transporter substrate-binding protein [Rhodococcus maanshanensis]|uniref:ABC transporter substrate-binding protein n=1 Tax=Rhodococcus maanshanensis TaxID=183556 RepID=UPI001FE4704A|nr:ABC transporter substrate-binding protein [Rhodococcus maanshanensis]